MINIITKYSNIGNSCIRDFESFFEKYVLSRDFDDMDLYAMQSIDKAVLLDKNIGTIQTRFGVSDILHLSTGCKVVLSYLYIKRCGDTFSGKVLDITECGSNALDVLFDCVEKLNDSETVFLLRHSNQLIKCKDRSFSFSVNGNKSDSLYEGVVLYG